jgi:hypothetical protein
VHDPVRVGLRAAARDRVKCVGRQRPGELAGRVAEVQISEGGRRFRHGGPHLAQLIVDHPGLRIERHSDREHEIVLVEPRKRAELLRRDGAARTLIRNLVLVGVGGVATAAASTRELDASILVGLAVAVVSAAGAMVIITLLRRYGQALLRIQEPEATLSAVDGDAVAPSVVAQRDVLVFLHSDCRTLPCPAAGDP